MRLIFFLHVTCTVALCQELTGKEPDRVLSKHAKKAIKLNNEAYRLYQNKAYERAYAKAIRALAFYPKDTILLRNVGIYYGPAAGKDNASIDFINNYKALGGGHTDADIQLYNLYMRNNKFEAALKVASELVAKYPNQSGYLNMQYNVYVKTNRLSEARRVMQKKVDLNSRDKESRYFLALVCNQMSDTAATKLWMESAVRIDPDYFEANLVLAKICYIQALAIQDKLKATSDRLKFAMLRRRLLEHLKESAFYWESCSKLRSSDPTLKEGLSVTYEWLSNYDPKYKDRAR